VPEDVLNPCVFTDRFVGSCDLSPSLLQTFPDTDWARLRELQGRAVLSQAAPDTCVGRQHSPPFRCRTSDRRLVTNAVVKPIHSKAMPVILTTDEERDVWMPRALGRREGAAAAVAR
jgi:hypothetical protein